MSQPYWSLDRLHLSLTTQAGNAGDRPRTRLLDRPFALVGSDRRCDLKLEGPTISRCCLCVISTGRGLGAIVLESNSRRAGQFMRVEPDRPIKLRGLEVTASIMSQPSQESAADALEHGPAGTDFAGLEASDLGELRAAPSPDQEASVWVVSWRSSVGRQFARVPHERPVLVGRRAPAHIAIEDPSLSAVHCFLYRRHDRLWVVDLCSSNGTFRDRQPVRAARLAPGRTLRLGNTPIRFHQIHLDPPEPSDAIRADAERADAERADAERSEGDVFASEHARSAFLQAQQDFEQQQMSWMAEREQWELQRSQQLAEVAIEIESQRVLRVEAFQADQERLAQARQAWEAERAEQQQRLSAQAVEHQKALQQHELTRQHWQAARDSLDQELSVREEQLQQELAKLAEAHAQWELDQTRLQYDREVLRHDCEVLQHDRERWHREQAEWESHRVEQLQQLADKESETRAAAAAFDEERAATQQQLAAQWKLVEAKHNNGNERSTDEAIEQQSAATLLLLCLVSEHLSQQQERWMTETAGMQYSLEESIQQRDRAEQLLHKRDAAIEQLKRQLDETTRQLAGMRYERDVWVARRQQVESRLAEREQFLKASELEAGRREVALIAMKATIRREQRELEDLQRIVSTQLQSATHQVPSGGMHVQVAGSHRMDHDTYLASADFHKILDKALSQPANDGDE